MKNTEIRLRFAETLADIPVSDWNACAYHQGGTPEHHAPCTAVDEISTQLSTRANRGNPFVTHEFLSALEESNSVGGRTGWQSRHLLAETPDGELLGASPCYVKMHSRGEYVFDHGWAEAFERAGGSYYPKLQVAVPFTPVTGPRILTKPGEQSQSVRRALSDALVEITAANGLSSAHVTFLTESEWRFLGQRGFLLRADQQFHWHNAGYGSFDDFLAALASRKRKTIRRERKESLSAGIDVQWLTGSALTESVWDAFFSFYMETGSRKWGRPYLSREFFSIVGRKMGERILLIMAKRAGRWIAGAINFIGDDTLYGRNWGAIEHHPFLHFEICYYQAIDYAIAHRLRRVEAGAQGEHKLARGYLPHTTYSAHFIANPSLRRAIADYLSRERIYVQAAGRELAAAAPFRKDLVEQD
ncbi:MAG TPA: GNAT family N-acetyltransferase [Pseudolabrys sp.]|nr:GNAT family N-acetyltransferase [Pseudolabrys sp.]